MSLCVINLCGGRTWLGHFAFPIAFILVAIPWPTQIENPFIQTLTDWVSSATVQGLNLCDVPAIQHGNTIELSSGMVGVEEACSGVRSFQASLMAALFLGQLWNFPLGTRALLVAAGVAFAFICNIVRALLLSFVAEKKGLEAIDKWHDPAGFTILGITFLGLLGIALWLRPKSGRALAASGSGASQTLPLPLSIGLAAWLLLTAVGTELWYRTAKAPLTTWWRVEWPVTQPAFTEIPASDKVRELSYDFGKQARWREDDGTGWTVFFFRWMPGMASARNFARWHNPEQCLPALGFKRIAEYEPTIYRNGPIELAFQSLRFDANGSAHYVFFCVWEDRAEPDGPKLPQQWNLAARINAVIERKRRLGQQVLEVVISGAKDETAARAALLKRLPILLRTDSILPAEDLPPKKASVQRQTAN